MVRSGLNLFKFFRSFDRSNDPNVIVLSPPLNFSEDDLTKTVIVPIINRA